MNAMSAKRFASVEEWDLDALRHAVRRGGPATPDDVSITMDGRPLDSREAVLTFLTKVESERPIEARMPAAGGDAVRFDPARIVERRHHRVGGSRRTREGL